MLDLIRLLISLFTGSKAEPKPNSVLENTTQPEPNKEVIEPLIRPLITLDDWITSSGRYPERANSPELTYDVKSAAMVLVDKVNKLGRLLNLSALDVSSGFRPVAVNNAIPHASRKSGHTIGFSIDFKDRDGKIDELLAQDASQAVLEQLELWQEHPSKTVNWAHVDYINRPIKARDGCKKRQFMP
jgi:hypothetical protein